MIDLKEQAGIAMNVRGQFSDPIVDPKVTLGALAFANDLGRALVRMKCGQDIRPDAVRRATLLLAQMIRRSGKFNRGKFTGVDAQAKREQRAGKTVERAKVDIVERFALRLIIEWVDDQCPRCEGRGAIGRTPKPQPVAAVCPDCNGKRVICVSEERIPFAASRSGRGPIVYREFESCPRCLGRGTVLTVPKKSDGRQICPCCGGDGRRPVDESARAHALGVSLPIYRRYWAERFTATLALLDKVDGSVVDTMRRQLQP
ncbi:zinc finger-like domain-containing protein [Paraburkholderia lacunae]|uniref:CR-type domain-containing protein n=1 Tax=Paraburkholderia lacunae TaxID=2211104 RepID=A0A370N7G1_9BURK|nr:zinc finger-like domain-containing protein [Paraburkholderia lacunae]RDK01448.1 hypothetical protein DLM46_16595 [Paraburkholderia lacunae]